MTDARDDGLREMLRKRDAVLNNPTREGALSLLPNMKFTDEEHGPLAAVHKARLVWTQATPTQVAESKIWLVEHGYKPGFDLGSAPTPKPTKDETR